MPLLNNTFEQDPDHLFSYFEPINIRQLKGMTFTRFMQSQLATDYI